MPDQARTRGTGSVFQRNGKGNWYVAFYSRNGEQVQYSTGSPIRAVAEKELRKQLTAVGNGMHVEEARTLRYEDIRENLIVDYGNRSVGLLADRLNPETGKIEKHLRVAASLSEFFKGYKVSNITTPVLNEFVAERKQHGYADATINRSLACLRKMMNLAKRSGLLSVVPYFPMQKEDNTREGFLEPAEFAKLLAAIPERLHACVLMLYTTGMRRSVPEQITWDMIDANCETMTLPARLLKNKRPLTIPIDAEVAKLLRKKFRTGVPFDTSGFRSAWKKATKAIGKPTLLVHDLRRSFAHNMVTAGVNQKTAMDIGGWRTASVFQRYCITDTADMKRAMEAVAMAAKAGGR